MTAQKPCRCGEIYGGDYGDEMCVDGMIYGPCQVQECGGVCEEVGTCLCDCHDETDPGARVAPGA